MSIKEEIHALSEEMVTNLGRLVAIDSQLGTPEEGKPFGAGPAKALEVGLQIADELGFKTVNIDNYCVIRDGRGRRDRRHRRALGHCPGRWRLEL